MCSVRMLIRTSSVFIFLATLLHLGTTFGDLFQNLIVFNVLLVEVNSSYWLFAFLDINLVLGVHVCQDMLGEGQMFYLVF